MKPRDTAALLLLSLLWGSAFMFNREAVASISPLTVVGGRLLLAALLLVPVVLLTGAAIPPRASWPALTFMAAFNNVVPFALITAAQEHISSSLAATLIGTMPLFTLAFALLLGTERPGFDRVAGLCIGFVGAVILIGPDLSDLTDSNTLGELAVVLSAAFYAISTIVARQYARGGPMALAAGQMLIGAAMAIPLALVVDGAPDFDIPVKAALSWIALGVFSSGLAYIVFFYLVQRITATQVSVVSFLIPIVATVLGRLVFGETFGPNLFVGLALILSGVVTLNGAARSLAERVRKANSAARAPV